jgi:hypothetical protein
VTGRPRRLVAVPDGGRATARPSAYRCYPDPAPADGERAHYRLCVECGRITSHVDVDGLPRHWPPPRIRVPCGYCAQPMTVIEPGQTLHPCCDPESLELAAVEAIVAAAGWPTCVCADPDARDCGHCLEWARVRRARRARHVRSVAPAVAGVGR